MSDATPDPMDKAYGQAEAMLSDEAARAERRARVLAAVASEQASAPAASSPPASRFPWRRGGWLAAAGVAGLSVLLATRVYPPSTIQKQAQQPPPAAEVRAPEARAVPSAPAPTAEPPATAAKSIPREPPPGAFARSDTAAAPVPASAPPVPVRVEEPPAAAIVVAPAPPPRPAETVVTARRRAETLSDAPHHTESMADAPPRRAPAESLGEVVVTSRREKAQAQGSAPGDEGARLRAAAAKNRTFELKTLLAEGARVDAPDAEGETALMKSIEAGHTAAAGILRRAGADLDLENRAGRSARDMAKAKDDPKLNQALGLDPLPPSEPPR